MGVLFTIYNEIIYRPLLNGLVFIYSTLPYHDLGLAILVLTVGVRLLMHPAIVQTIRSQQAMARLQPKLQEIQTRFKDNKEEQTRRLTALYKEEGVHPLSGCLPMVIQLPILIGLYRVFWKGIKLQDPLLLYSFLPAVTAFNPISFGIFNLTGRSVVLAVAAGVSQFFQGWLLPPQASPAKGGAADFNRMLKMQTTYFFPVIIIGISWSLPSALAFYWTVLNIFAILQQLWIQKRLKHERDSRTNQPNPGENGHPGRSGGTHSS